ncbi:MAG TPA: hypothetical protein PKY72_04570 [Bacilli bacterium]|nr:hypothetical protein [Bacilli bacterium]
MATLRELSYNVYQLLRANGFDDDDIDIRTCMFWINNERAMFLKQYLNKVRANGNLTVPEEFYQDLGIYELELIEADHLKTSLNRTKNPIPEIMFNGNKPLIKIYNLDLRTSLIKVLDNYNINGVGGGLFNRHMLYAFLDNTNKVCITGYDNNTYANRIKNINIKAVLKDPMNASNFTLDSNYPIDLSYVPYLEDAIAKTYIAHLLGIRNDPVNNAKNDLN